MKKSFVKLAIVLFVVLILGGTGNVYAEDFDFPETIMLGQTYDINWDEWLDLYNYVGYDVSSGGIIEVSEDLIVTGIKPGIEYLTIYYEDDYGSYQDVYKITVKATDGVYRIKNTNTGKYLELSNSIVKGDVPVICDETGICMEQLWRLENIGDDLFKIRPYIDNNALLMYAADSEAIIVTESKALYSPKYEDSLAMWWKISEGCYSLNTSNMNICYNNTNGVYMGATYPDYLWEFEPVNEAEEGITICDTYNNRVGSVAKRYIPKNSVKNLNDLKIKVLDYFLQDNDSTLEWSTSNSLVAAIDINTGTVTGISPGVAIITCSKTVDGVVYRGSYTLEVKPFEDGVYSLGGYANSCYTSIASETADYKVRLYERGSIGNGQEPLNVYLMLDIDGYYQISVAGTENNNILSNDRYNLGISDSDESTPVTLYNMHDENTDKESLRFRIEENQEYNGFYNIYPKKNVSGTDALLAVGDNGYIFYNEVDEEDYDYLWGISPVVSQYDLVVYLRPIYDQDLLDDFNSKTDMISFLDESIDKMETVFYDEFGVTIVCDEYTSFESIDIDNDKAVGNIYNEWLKYYNDKNDTTYTANDLELSKKML